MIRPTIDRAGTLSTRTCERCCASGSTNDVNGCLVILCDTRRMAVFSGAEVDPVDGCGHGRDHPTDEI